MSDTNTIAVDVKGIGRFEFAERTMRLEFRVAAEYSRLTDGLDNPAGWLASMAEAWSVVSVLALDAPPGWDMEAMDPLDPQSYKQVGEVYRALREKEMSFRKGGGPKREKGGARASEDDPVPVPAQV